MSPVKGHVAHHPRCAFLGLGWRARGGRRAGELVVGDARDLAAAGEVVPEERVAGFEGGLQRGMAGAGEEVVLGVFVIRGVGIGVHARVGGRRGPGSGPGTGGGSVCGRGVGVRGGVGGAARMRLRLRRRVCRDEGGRGTGGVVVGLGIEKKGFRSLFGMGMEVRHTGDASYSGDWCLIQWGVANSSGGVGR